MSDQSKTTPSRLKRWRGRLADWLLRGTPWVVAEWEELFRLRVAMMHEALRDD
jgi:hypothetical protein